MYYPDQRLIIEQTTIRRERLLPEDVIGQIEVREGVTVNLRDIIARGRVSSRCVIVEAAEFFGLRHPEDLNDLLLVETGQAVEARAPLAAREGRRGKRLLSPVDGLVVYIGGGRIIVQETPEQIDLEAGFEGQVIAVQPGRGVLIETFGGLAQGVWGNNRRAIGVLRMEPEDGLETIYGDELNTMYRGAIVVTKRPLRATGLMVIEDQGILGVIAPSMELNLLEQALRTRAAILLTEGFGPIRMSAYVFNLLSASHGKQAAVDAALPNRWDARRPEVIINPSSRSAARPPRPSADVVLAVGSTVRLTRQPNAGGVGKVINLPKTPLLMDNGLRMLCAQVELLTGERVTVPLVNLEVFGK